MRDKRDVDQKGRHQQEDRRHHASQGVELPKLRVQKGMRQLIRPPERACAAIARQEIVELLDHSGLGCTGKQLNGQAVERPIKIEQ